MKPLSPLRKAIAASALLCTALLAPASGLISAEAANVMRMRPPVTAGARGKQLATLHSYLLTDTVTVGIDTGDMVDARSQCIQRAIQVWMDSINDCPFAMAQPGQKPMIVVRFVDGIDGDAGGDIQGQVEATRMLHWGSSVSYKIEGLLQVVQHTGHRDLRDDELTEVIAHELGHILGLDDAQECVGLMGPFVPGRPRMRPSRDEVDAVVRYREQLRSAIAKLEAQK